jgi:N-carbamoyl-L-amino-acid hydrolase
MPGAMNVVPGEVEMKIDIRSSSTQSRQRVLEHLQKSISAIKQRRELEIESIEISMENPVLLSPEIIDLLENLCEDKNLPYKIMQSGAGHDAMNMTGLGPVGLIFIPSEDGISHHPNEHTEIADILAGIELLEATVLQYSKAYPPCNK